MASQDDQGTVQLDRAQREGIRKEIEVLATGYGDIGLSFKAHQLDRGLIVAKLEELKGCVAMLDAIGWTDPYDAPEVVTVNVDTVLMSWARDEAFHLRRCLPEIHPNNTDLDALSGLQLVAGETGGGA